MVVGKRLGYCQVAVHADASKTRHGNTFENRDDISKHPAGQRLVDACGVVQEGEGGDQAAHSDEQVGVRHGLDEAAGGAVVQERGAVKDEDDRQVAGDDQTRQQDDHHRLEDADVHRAVAAKSQRARGTLGHVHEATAQVHELPC